MAKKRAPGPIVINVRPPTPAVDLADRVSDMPSDQLTRLHANSLRLQTSGSARFQETAAKMLPLIEAELDSRRQLHEAAKAAKPVRAARKAAKTLNG